MGKGSVGLVFGVWFLLVFVAVFGVVLNVPVVGGSGTIYIRADGSIDPPTAPIQRDGDVYTFIGNVYNPIVVERNNIVIDGIGYTAYADVSVKANNVTLKKAKIRFADVGLYGSNSSLLENNITNTESISLWGYTKGIHVGGSNNTLFKNNIVNSRLGLYYTSGSKVHGNTISGVNLTVFHSFSSIIYENSIDYGSIFVGNSSSSNTIYGNNIVKGLRHPCR